MTNLESIRSLQKRIREATGPDRELDCIVHAVMDGREIREEGNLILARNCRPPHDAYVVGSIDPGREQRNFSEGYSLPLPPHYTLDPDGLGPCVALMRMLLPGWPGSVSWNNLETNGGTSFAYVHTPIGYDGPSPWPEGSLHHNNTCLALLYAIFSAAIAKEEAKEKAGA